MHANVDPFFRSRHVRYVEPQVVYHVISRTRGNLYLMRPDRSAKLRRIVAGILAVAKSNYPEVANYGLSMLSNHFHGCLAARNGDPGAIADYMRFLKGELTRRWSDEVGWSGSIWEGYEATAVITPEQQLAVLDYVIGQGVKENLVESPLDWPGFHCAESLVTGEPVRGHWLDGTAYGIALRAEKVKKHPRSVVRDDYLVPKEFSFDRLPVLEHLSDDEYQTHMCDVVERIVEEGRERRGSKPVLGVEMICAMDPLTSSPVPSPPWFENRRRMVVWDDLSHPEVDAYLRRYWAHQVRYRKASHRWRNGETEAVDEFPETCFIPGRRARPIAHMEGSTG